MGDLAAYAFELTQPDAEALYTHVDVGFEDQAVIQGAPRARAASPTSTSSTAMNEMELLEKGRLWASRRDLADDVNHFEHSQNKNMTSAKGGSAGGKCLVLRCDCAVDAKGKLKSDATCNAKVSANATLERN
jgi:hypothetical protein